MAGVRQKNPQVEKFEVPGEKGLPRECYRLSSGSLMAATVRENSLW